MDNSFLKLYNSIEEAMSDDLFKDRQMSLFLSIQLSPKETYSQQTNYQGGISFQEDFTIEIVDNCGSLLKDITDNVLIDEFTDSQGQNQAKIEIVNITEDFYGRAVFIKFRNNVANDEYFTRPIKITDKSSEKTYRFDYWNTTNLNGLTYVNSQFKQSIRLALKFVDFNNKSTISDYRQATTGNTISGLDEMSVARDYLLEQLDTFTFLRLQKLLFHNNIYLDGVRITNKPILEQGGRIGHINLLKASFTAFTSDSDTFDYEYQLFEGFNYQEFTPTGNTTLAGLSDTALVRFNLDVTLLSGNIGLYNKDTNELINVFNQSEMIVIDGDTISFNGLTTHITENGEYYFKISGGLVESTALGVLNTAILDSDTWGFKVGGADFLGTDFNNNDFFTN